MPPEFRRVVPHSAQFKAHHIKSTKNVLCPFFSVAVRKIGARRIHKNNYGQIKAKNNKPLAFEKNILVTRMPTKHVQMNKLH